MSPSVQFVSKPVDPPINDGSKHVVLTLASHLERYAPRVMTTRGVSSVGCGIEVDAIYEPASSYAPSLLNNVRAAIHIALRARADIWHFVFAPNARSSQMGRLLSRVRGIPVLQTIASRPRTFDNPLNLLFGNVVVAQSHDTRAQFMTALKDAAITDAECPRIEVIGPPLGEVAVPSLDATNAVRRSLSLATDVPLLLYPGDLEVGKGAKRVAESVPFIVARHPSAVVVFAYRDKTASASAFATELQRELEQTVPAGRVRFVRESTDILALVRTTAAILFPVDDLYGKVDIPIVLLEAMALGTPVVTCAEGPLGELAGTVTTLPGDARGLAEAALSLIDDYGRRGGCIEAQLALLADRFSATVVAGAYERLYDELLAQQG